MLPIDTLTKSSKILLYIQNMRALLRREALYSDGTEEYIVPTEPQPGQTAKIRFRTSTNNAEMVYFCTMDVRIEMCIIKKTDMFDYYETEIEIGTNTIDYHFEIVNGFERCFYDKLGVTDGYRTEYPFRIIPGFSTPKWAKGAVMYQIFVDRFYNGDKTNDVETNEYSYIDAYTTKVDDWHKYPAAMGVREFYGGDLQGVIDKLDYLQGLGIEAIYLNPIFVSPSNHKYDIQDYDNIDPHYGKIVFDEGELLQDYKLENRFATKYINRVTNKKNLDASNELFAQLTTEAHKRGIHIIIDGVFNHCGSFNKWLDKELIYTGQDGYEDGAYASYTSPYNNFFKFFEDEENEWPLNASYDGWWGHDTLPKLNYEESPELEAYIMKVAAKWVSPPYNVDGWRLDVAADLGHSPEYNHKFWQKFRQTVKEANPNAIILAEHYGDPSPWLRGDQWDTVMNYDAFMEPISWFLTGMEKHSDDKNPSLLGDASHFFNTMNYNMAKFHTQSLLVAMNELSNHDHSRFLTRTNGYVGRTAYLGPEVAEKAVNKAVLKEAVVMQMTWPGAPTIYYGDEAGLCGWTDPDNRRTYPWGSEDKDLINFHREMIRIHKENSALKTGSYKPLHEDYNVIVYTRFDRHNRIIVAINNNVCDKDVKINVFAAGIPTESTVEKLIESGEVGYSTYIEQYTIKNEILSITMPPKSAMVFRGIDDDEIIYCSSLDLQ